MGGIFEADAGDRSSGFDRGSIAADEVNHHRFWAGFRDLVDLFGNRWRRRFGNEHDQVCFRIRNEGLEALDHHQPADLLLEVAPAGADHLGEPLTEFVYLNGDFLGSGSRGADHADLPPPDGVGKAQGFAVDDRRTAVRTHHQQAFFDSFLLESQFVFNRDVVREEHHVQPCVKRFVDFRRGIFTRDGHQDHVRPGHGLDGGAQRGRLKIVIAIRFGSLVEVVVERAFEHIH